MSDRKKIIASALALSIGAGLAGGAAAQAATSGDRTIVAQAATTGNTAVSTRGEEADELQAIQNAKLTIADAAKVAETETGGKAMDVSIGDENGRIAYQVEVVMNDGTVRDVHLDTQTGQVLKVSAGDEDRNGDEDRDGDEGENGED